MIEEYEPLIEGHPATSARNEEESDFVAHLESQSLAPLSIYCYLGYFRMFNKGGTPTQQSVNAFIAEHCGLQPRAFMRQYLMFKKIRDIDVPKIRGATRKRIVPVIPLEHVPILRNALKKKKPMFALMFDISVYTGLRRAELTGITIKDLYIRDWQDHQPLKILIKGKRNKQRIVVVPPETADALLDYVADLMERHKLQSGDKIFKINASYWYQILQETSKKIFGVSYPPHSFRHLFITEALRNKIPIEVIASRCGHSCIDTTQRYSTISPQEVANNWADELSTANLKSE